MNHIVENFFDSSSVLITCFKHICESMVFDTYHNYLYYNKRVYFRMVADSIQVSMVADSIQNVIVIIGKVEKSFEAFSTFYY